MYIEGIKGEGMKTFYHLSLKDHEQSILENGLIPQWGARSELINEVMNAVYLFKSEQDVENALLNWYGEWCEDNGIGEDEVVLFRVTLPEEFTTFSSPEQFEVFTTEHIPSEYIEFMRYE